MKKISFAVSTLFLVLALNISPTESASLPCTTSDGRVGVRNFLGGCSAVSSGVQTVTAPTTPITPIATPQAKRAGGKGFPRVATSSPVTTTASKTASKVAQTGPVLNACYFYSPTYFSNPASLTFNLDINNGAQTKTLTLPNQQPVTILQDVGFNAVPHPRPTWYTGPYLCPAGIMFTAQAITPSFVVSGNLIPVQPFYLDWVDPRNGSDLEGYWVNPFSEISASTAQDRITKEDLLISAVDTNKTVTSRIVTGAGYYSYMADASFPATNCAKISGTGPKKVVFMRGNQWNSSLSDYLWKVDEAKTAILATDPFKTLASQFSFYVDLKKQDQQTAINSSAATAKAQSSCGSDGSQYIYFYKEAGLGKGTFSYPTGGVSFIEYADFTHTTKGSLSAVREMGRAIGGLYKETVQTPIIVTPPTDNNCGYNPFTSFRDSATNHIYGAIDKTSCFRDSYYRPNDKSLLGNDYNSTQPTISANKFDVISCGYIVAGLNGKALTKANALLYWPTCKTYDTAKDGIPPAASLAPVITDTSGVPKTGNQIVFSVERSAITQGSQMTLVGSNYTDKGNSVYISNIVTPTQNQEINNITSSENLTNLSFVVPNLVPGRYSIKAGALNSEWSNALSFDLHGAGPTNFTAVADSGKVNISWNDNSLDETGFVVYRQTENPFSSFEIDVPANQTSVIDEQAGPKTYTYVVGADFADNKHSPQSNSAIVNLSKPKPPVLSVVAGSGNSVLLSWTVQNSDSINGYRIERSPSDEFVVSFDGGHRSYKDGVTDPFEGGTTELSANTQYCYTVIAEVNANNKSDKSNVACAVVGVGSLEASSESIEGNSTVSFDTGQTGAQISSVDFTVDGRSIGTDNSAPYNTSFDSTQFTNGPHNLSSTINYVSPRQSIVITPKIIQVQNPLLVTSVVATSTSPRTKTFVVNGSGFTATGNKVRLTYTGPVSVLPNIFYQLSRYARSLVAAVAPLINPTPGAAIEITGLNSSGGVIIFTVPEGVPVGRYTLSVATANEDWKTTNLTITVSNTMRVVGPTLTSLSKTSATPGSSLIAIGYGFATSTNTDKVELTFATSTYVVTAIIMSGPNSAVAPPPGVTVNSGQYTSFALPRNIAPGTYNVRVANQDSNWSNPLILTVPSPILGVAQPVSILPSVLTATETYDSQFLPSVASTTVSSFCYTFNRDLGVEMSLTGVEVNALQTIFSREGINGNNFTDYDESVASLVIQFQEKYRLPLLSGYVGPATRDKLNQIYGCGG